MQVNIKNVCQSYGNARLFENLDLTIPSGQFFSLLGPSGCGKTTLLRMLAGFIRPDSGKIFFGDRDMTNVPVHRRNIGMVFQDYALFPDRSVLENVIYGLRARGVARAQACAKGEEMLGRVGLEGFGSRMPSQLSGGQKQRVAMARALVIDPELLLLDEPLSALDVKLRIELRHLIRQLQTSSGITTVFVTHDQSEALAMSDHIALLRHGRIMQLGTPLDIHERPSCLFVAEFLGMNRIPVLSDEGRSSEGLRRMKTAAGVLVTDDAAPFAAGMHLAVRPTDIRVLEPAGEADGLMAGTVSQVEFRGVTVEYVLATAAGDIHAEVPTEGRIRAVGEAVSVAVSPCGRLVGERP